jgi:hypothetical protein
LQSSNSTLLRVSFHWVAVITYSAAPRAAFKLPLHLFYQVICAHSHLKALHVRELAKCRAMSITSQPVNESS